MRTPEGWHKAWLGIRHCFKMSQTQKTRARPGSERRYGPRHYIPPLRGSHLFFWGGSRGSAPYGAPPPGYFIAPLRGSNLGSLTLAITPFNSDLSRSRVSRGRRIRRHHKYPFIELFGVQLSYFKRLSDFLASTWPWSAAFLYHFLASEMFFFTPTPSS